MTKTSKLFISGGLAILIIGLAIGAYFFFQASDGPSSGILPELKEWRNDAGQLHRENDQPAYIEYDESGEIVLEKWYLNGELIKAQPPSI